MYYMKIVYTATFLFVLCFSAFGNSVNDAKDLKINNFFNLSDPCVNSYTFDFEGTINRENSFVIKEYILNKVGICTVDFNMETKKITVSDTEKIDFESIKWLVKKAFHDYAIHEDSNTSN